MLTKRQAVILVSGHYQNFIMARLENLEALVPISSQEEIEQVWKQNKTPIVPLRSVPQIIPNYVGQTLIFTAPQIFPPFDQQVVTKAITQFCYKNLIDPGQLKTESPTTNSSDECKFCRIAQHHGISTFDYNLGADFVNMIIYETENYVVIPGIGPLAAGYLMIISKEHYSSLRQLLPGPTAFEYQDILEDIELILKQAYGLDVAFYELAPKANCATKHMHVDCMLNADLSDFYKRMLGMRPVKYMTFMTHSLNYLTYMWGSKGTPYASSDPEVYLPMQVHRQIYAERENLAPNQFDWRQAPFAERTQTTIWQLYKFLSNESLLSDRIKKRTRDFVEAAAKRFDY